MPIAFIESLQLALDMISVVNSLQERFAKIADSLKKIANTIGQFSTYILEITAKQQSIRDLLIAQVGDFDVGKKLFEDIEKQAIISGQNVNEAIKGALSFYSVTADEDQIMELYNIASVLSSLSSNELSVPEAANAVTGAFRGEDRGSTSALTSDFHLPSGEVDKLMTVAESGNMDSFISSFNELLKKEGMTQEALSYMMDSPINKWNALIGTFESKLIGVGDKIMTAIKPALDKLYQALSNGEFDYIFDGISYSLLFLANMVSYVTDGFIKASQFIKENWTAIQPILSAIGTILLTVVAVALMIVLNIFVALALVFSPIIAGIYLLSYVFQQLGVTFSDVLIFLFGRLYLLVEIIKTFVIAPIWNAVATLADAIVNAFVSKDYALRKFFYDIGEYVQIVFLNILKTINGATQMAADAVNKLINFSNNKFGTSFGNLDGNILNLEIASAEWDLNQYRKTMPEKPEGTSNLPRIDSIFEPLDAIKHGEGIMSGWLNDANAIFDNFKFPGTSDNRDYQTKNGNSQKGYQTMVYPNIPNIDTVGTVNNLGNVEGTVDISSEDLKMMRDLAEMQAIQHFVTLTPTVQMTTGDINSGADLDTIVGHIGRKLEEEFVSTAQGVYT